MGQGLSHHDLHGASLAGLLAQLALMEAPAEKPSFVEGLGGWIGWADAIPLSAAIGAPPAELPALAGVARLKTYADTAEREFTRVRSALIRAIEDDGLAAKATTRLRGGRAQPADHLALPPAADTEGGDFSVHRQRYTSLQQTMASSIARVRAQVRELVARVSPAMHRLAALDAVMADALEPRQQALLMLMPSLLQKHFDRLLRGHRDAPHGSTPSDPWLVVFQTDMRHMLLAELNLRLQPVLGLIEALRSPQQGSHE